MRSYAIDKSLIEFIKEHFLTTYKQVPICAHLVHSTEFLLIDTFNKFYAFLDTVPNVVMPERTEVNALQTNFRSRFNHGKKSFPN